MKAKQLFFAATHPPSDRSRVDVSGEDPALLRQLKARAAQLPIEGSLPSLVGATGWLNSQPLTPEELRGRVVLIDFWTYTCINWLRTLPYVAAWAKRYGDKGLTVIGVHTPEFPFERDVENIRQAARDMRVEFPIAIDSNYGIWRAFDNHYWPALYFVDAQGRIRHHHFGEGAYEISEVVLQQMLADAGFSGFNDDVVSVDPTGLEVAADWENQESPETYLGYKQGDNFASPGGFKSDERHTYSVPAHLRLNQWALSGVWTVRGGPAVLSEKGGRIAFRFHARDVNLVMGPSQRGASARFRVFLDGKPATAAHGSDVNAQGQGAAGEQRTYQLIRQAGEIDDRTFEIEFLETDIETYAFTFG
jgi:thiol-disulfide isomerase/thioredoxin